jgi:hypothetical protein
MGENSKQVCVDFLMQLDCNEATGVTILCQVGLVRILRCWIDRMNGLSRREAELFANGGFW